MGMIKIGLCGHGCQNLFERFRAIHGLMSLRCLTFGKARGKKIHRTTATICLYEELIDDLQIEAVAIATPAATHFSFARRAILRDKHVLVERPMCASLPEAKELAGLAAEYGTTLMVDHISVPRRPPEAETVASEGRPWRYFLLRLLEGQPRAP